MSAQRNRCGLFYCALFLSSLRLFYSSLQTPWLGELKDRVSNTINMPICPECRKWSCRNSTGKGGNGSSTKLTSKPQKKLPTHPDKLSPPICCGEDYAYHDCDPVLVFGDTLRALLAYPNIHPMVLKHARGAMDKDLPAVLFCRSDLIYHSVGNARTRAELDAFLGHLLVLWTRFGPPKSGEDTGSESRPVKNVSTKIPSLIDLDISPTENAALNNALAEKAGIQLFLQPAILPVTKPAPQLSLKQDTQSGLRPDFHSALLYETPFRDSFEAGRALLGILDKDSARS